jgi:UDP-2,3-diacylglucosamine pyrophosphatase LpxH
MTTSERLSGVFDAATEVTIDDNSRVILFSDCHRGVNDWADDFAPNQNLYFHALTHYNEQGFTYVELGDGDELWEAPDFATIHAAHSHVFWLMREFYKDGRLYIIYGNHDMERADPAVVKQHFETYFDPITRQDEPLFPGITLHEGIRLRYAGTEKSLFLLHGHQGDPLNDRPWRIGAWLVRRLWRPMQLLGFRDPTSAAQNYEKRNEVEQNLLAWVDENGNQPLICGHTHRSVFPRGGGLAYFNTGSCVHPRCITGLEIADGQMTLIKWWIRPDEGGLLRVVREPLEAPRSLRDILGVEA